MEKTRLLEDLRGEILSDMTLPFVGFANLVFGEGKPDCDILFIGEAPGANEDKLGRPFVGRSGKLLDRLIALNDWKREDVYITNIVKRRPPDNRDPFQSEIDSYRPYLGRQIEIIEPKVIAPLGRFAMNFFIPNGRISRDQGRTFWWGERIVVPIYHPAAALRATAVMKELEESFRKLPQIIARHREFVERKRNSAPPNSPKADPEFNYL